MKKNYSALVPILRAGGTIAYPTEAVFGLGCDPDNEAAVTALLALKQRPSTKGLILVGGHADQLIRYVDFSALSEEKQATIFNSWPGPTTWLLPPRATVPAWILGQYSMIAVRVPGLYVARKLCMAYGKALISTSANLTGMPACRTALEVRNAFGAQFPVLLGKVGGRTNPSEIRNAVTGQMIRTG